MISSNNLPPPLPVDESVDLMDSESTHFDLMSFEPTEPDLHSKKFVNVLESEAILDRIQLTEDQDLKNLANCTIIKQTRDAIYLQPPEKNLKPIILKIVNKSYL